MLSPVELRMLATEVPTDPVVWLASFGAFAPFGALLWYLYIDTRKERDHYRDIVERMAEDHSRRQRPPARRGPY